MKWSQYGEITHGAIGVAFLKIVTLAMINFDDKLKLDSNQVIYHD